MEWQESKWDKSGNEGNIWEKGKDNLNKCKMWEEKWGVQGDPVGLAHQLQTEDKKRKESKMTESQNQ